MTTVSPRDTGGEMKTVTSADGTQIAFERTGSGPPLVLVHGGATNDRNRWELAGVRSTFAEHFTVFAMDCRGRGESGDGGEYALEREAEDVAAVVAAIDEPVSLLGHSSGALYSLEAALRTDNLRRLVLYEPPVMVGEHELVSESVLTEIRRFLADGENEQALGLFLRNVAGLTPEELETLRAAPNWPARVAVAQLIPRALQGVAEYEFDPTRFADMTTPTLLLAGDESPTLYREATVAVSDALPNCRVVTFEGHQHVAMLTATDRFIDEVLGFVQKSR